MMIMSNLETFDQPATCWHCHADVFVRFVSGSKRRQAYLLPALSGTGLQPGPKQAEEEASQV